MIAITDVQAMALNRDDVFDASSSPAAARRLSSCSNALSTREGRRSTGLSALNGDDFSFSSFWSSGKATERSLRFIHMMVAHEPRVLENGEVLYREGDRPN